MKSLLALVLAIVTATLVACSRSAENTNSASPSANVPPASVPTPTPGTTPPPMLEPTPGPTPDAGATPSATPTPTTQTTGEGSSTEVILRVEDRFVVFEVKQCRKSGSSIACEFSLTNTGPDREFGFNSRGSSLYDELGNGYRGADAQIANQTGEYPRIGFVSGVTTKARMAFEGIDPNATQITLLRLQFKVGDSDWLDVRFRNVPLLGAK